MAAMNEPFWYSSFMAPAKEPMRCALEGLRTSARKSFISATALAVAALALLALVGFHQGLELLAASLRSASAASQRA